MGAASDQDRPKLSFSRGRNSVVGTSCLPERGGLAAVERGRAVTDPTLSAARLFVSKTDALLRLLGAMAADPVGLVPVAQNAGVNSATFHACGDLFLLWCTFQVAADYRLGRELADRRRALQFCRLLLKRHRLWEDVSPRGANVMQWSDDRLVELFESTPRSAVYVRKLAKDAVALHRRLCEAAEHLRQAQSLLEVA